jgi:methionine synthase II (cobalamin-independent)
MVKEDKEGLLKRAVIAGAAHALRQKEKRPYDSESEILKQIVKEVKSIIKEIDE